MSIVHLRRTRAWKFVLLCLPLLAFAFVCALPVTSVRLSLISQGHPFAHIVPKSRLNIFDYVPIDNFRNAGIVFADGSDKKAIGWVYQPMSGFARFVPFSTTPPTLSLSDDFDFIFDYVFFLLWVGKWLWLPGSYALILLALSFMRRRRQSARVSDS